jgi:peptidoglycan/LPS O-acetylase OafA/YrhL
MGKLAEENKLLGLEIIRFFASLAVLYYHYKHFINNIIVTSRVVDVNQPFFHVFAPFYIYGYYGVHLFWYLSGLFSFGSTVIP